MSNVKLATVRKVSDTIKRAKMREILRNGLRVERNLLGKLRETEHSEDYKKTVGILFRRMILRGRKDVWFLSALDKDEVIGFCMYKLSQEGALDLGLIHVEEGSRNKGIGTLMLREILDKQRILQETGIEPRTFVVGSGLFAMDFYLKFPEIKFDKIVYDWWGHIVPGTTQKNLDYFQEVFRRIGLDFDSIRDPTQEIFVFNFKSEY